jgi:hypothetical protein
VSQVRQPVGHDEQLVPAAGAADAAGLYGQRLGQRRRRRGLAAARGRDPAQQRSDRGRIGQTPARAAAALRANQDRLVGHPERLEHVLVGQVIPKREQTGSSACLLAQPGHG